MSEKYDLAAQELFISMMLQEPELFTRCQNILKKQYFDRKYEDIVEFIHDFQNEHNALPQRDIIKAKFKTKFELLDDLNQSHKEWFLDTIEDFCKMKAIEYAIIKGQELLENGAYEQLEKLVKDAQLVSLQRDLGTDYFLDPVSRLNKLKDQNGTISTGWKTVDEVVYQIGRGELIIFTAFSGGGKSVAMQNITLNFAKQGLNVVYFTLELSEELVAKRLDAMLTGISNASIFKSIDDVALRVKQSKKDHGNIFVKYMDSGQTPNDIKSYLKEFQIQHGVAPDAIVVDYLDLLGYPGINASDVFNKDKMVAESLRNIGSVNNYNLVCITASQVNRSGYDEHVVGSQHIAGGISKINTADLVIHINNTTQLRERGEIEFSYTKTRNSGGLGKMTTLEYDTDTLKISDLDENSENKHDGSTGSVSPATQTSGNIQAMLDKVKKIR